MDKHTAPVAIIAAMLLALASYSWAQFGLTSARAAHRHIGKVREYLRRKRDSVELAFL